MNFYCIIYGTLDELMTLNVGCEENLAAIYANDPEGKLIIKDEGKVVTALHWGFVQGVIDLIENQKRLEVIQGPPGVAQGPGADIIVPRPGGFQLVN